MSTVCCVLCVGVCVCVCVKPKDSPKTNTEHLGASSGEHHRGRVAVKRERQRLREESLWGPCGEGDKQEDRKRQSSRYTEQGAFSVCHIRTVASAWNLCSFLRYFQRGPQVPLTKYGPTPAFKQTRLFLYLQLEVADKWLTSYKGPFCYCTSTISGFTGPIHLLWETIYLLFQASFNGKLCSYLQGNAELWGLNTWDGPEFHPPHLSGTE